VTRNNGSPAVYMIIADFFTETEAGCDGVQKIRGGKIQE
jgi:hypothetical protein